MRNNSFHLYQAYGPKMSPPKSSELFTILQIHYILHDKDLGKERSLMYILAKKKKKKTVAITQETLGNISTHELCLFLSSLPSLDEIQFYFLDSFLESQLNLQLELPIKRELVYLQQTY
jgi:hypothetical protein